RSVSFHDSRERPLPVREGRYLKVRHTLRTEDGVRRSPGNRRILISRARPHERWIETSKSYDRLRELEPCGGPAIGEMQDPAGVGTQCGQRRRCQVIHNRRAAPLIVDDSDRFSCSDPPEYGAHEVLVSARHHPRRADDQSLPIVLQRKLFTEQLASAIRIQWVWGIAFDIWRISASVEYVVR